MGGVAPAVAAFVGLAEKGPFNEPTLCSNWTQFINTFGGFIEGAYLSHAVYGYFLNGGGNSYIVRIGGENGTAPVPMGELGSGGEGKVNGHRVRAPQARAARHDNRAGAVAQTRHDGPPDG